MRAIMLMFDSLKRDWLPPYGGDIVAPNFERLAERTVTFDNFYIGSMPCMPARRELHTGRYNFLHKGWSPLEPFDDSVPEMLKQAGVHCHLVSDHHHYWRDGGANYHPRYSTYEHVRGQEGDYWKGVIGASFENTTMSEEIPAFFRSMFVQDEINRKHMPTEDKHCLTTCYDAGLEFIETNIAADNWFVNIESFDPHEPFFTYDEYRALYTSEYSGRHVDWPTPGKVTQDEDYIRYVQNQYKALVSQIDINLGRILDTMDNHNMWDDTMLIVTTDHGLLLGEHEWWSKGAMPTYNEIARLPFFIWDPRYKKAGERRQSLAQNIDVAATLLEFFDQPLTKDMMGRPLAPVIENDSPIHSHILFGYFGGAVNIADGRYVYMRGPASLHNSPLYEYTLMPARMGSRVDLDDIRNFEISPPFSFTKDCRTLKIDLSHHNSPYSNPYRYGSRLYDLEVDPGQNTPVTDTAVERALIRKMIELMEENDAPKEQYTRLSLCKDVTEEELRAQKEEFLAGLQSPAQRQIETLAALTKSPDIVKAFGKFIAENNYAKPTTQHVYEFAKKILPVERAGMAIMMLKLNEEID